MKITDLFGTQPVKKEWKECPAPGIYPGVSSAAYHSWEAVSSSIIKRYGENPFTCHAPILPTDDMTMGTGQHSFTLQGQAGFDAECIILPIEAEGTSKAAKTVRAEYAQNHPGKALLPFRYGTGAAESKTPAMEAIKAVDANFRNDAFINNILSAPDNGFELSVVWDDEETGLRCKARFDIWQAKPRTIWDLKKWRWKNDLNAFKWEIKDRGYDIQAGFYMMGAEAAGLCPKAFGFIPYESSAPYRVAAGYLNDAEEGGGDSLSASKYEARRLLSLYKQSIDRDLWPNNKIPAHVRDLDDITAYTFVHSW